MVSVLSHAGRLGDPYFILTSDYGSHVGLHRVRGAKRTPYTEAHEVPFVVRGPDIPRDESFDDIAANSDLAPPVPDLAELSSPGWMDGRSFAPFLDDRPPRSD